MNATQCNNRIELAHLDRYLQLGELLLDLLVNCLKPVIGAVQSKPKDLGTPDIRRCAEIGSPQFEALILVDRLVQSHPYEIRALGRNIAKLVQGKILDTWHRPADRPVFLAE